MINHNSLNQNHISDRTWIAHSAYAVYGSNQRINLVMAKKAERMGHTQIAYSLRAIHMLMQTLSQENPKKVEDVIDGKELIADHLFDICMDQEKIRREQNRRVFAA